MTSLCPSLLRHNYGWEYEWTLVVRVGHRTGRPPLASLDRAWRLFALDGTKHRTASAAGALTSPTSGALPEILLVLTNVTPFYEWATNRPSLKMDAES